MTRRCALSGRKNDRVVEICASLVNLGVQARGFNGCVASERAAFGRIGGLRRGAHIKRRLKSIRVIARDIVWQYHQYRIMHQGGVNY